MGSGSSVRVADRRSEWPLVGPRGRSSVDHRSWSSIVVKKMGGGGRSLYNRNYLFCF